MSYSVSSVFNRNLETLIYQHFTYDKITLCHIEEEKKKRAYPTIS